VALVLIPSAATANGDPLLVGSSANSATAITTLSTTGTTGLEIVDPTPGAIAVKAIASSGTGNGWGVYGESDASDTGALGVYGRLTTPAPGGASAGVLGISESTTPYGPGVFGVHGGESGSAPGVEGLTNSTSADAAGVRGRIFSAAANAAGVRGENASLYCCGMGVAGFHSGSGIGVYGEALNGFAVSGFSPNNWSGYFQGSVNVVGTLYKSSGAFRIDNPLDPAHAYLQHSFVESPDMKNVYDGVIRTNGKGFATVKLPDWFQALNRDFRYQLTTLAQRGWDAKAGIWKKLHDNAFTIRTDRPKIEVSWQITGIRHDAYANANRIQTVVPKTGSADGKYVYPELYGKPMSKSVVVLPGMTPATKPKFADQRTPTQK